LNHGSRKLKLIESNYKQRIGRSSNCTSYSSKPRQHYLRRGIAAPGGRGYGEEVSEDIRMKPLPYPCLCVC
jgi:hypothetical protein